jgi:simple sugar transport system permease protein
MTTETVPLGYQPPPMNRQTLWRRIPAIIVPASFAESITISVAALLASMIVFGIFVTLSGANPFEVYHLIYRGAFGTTFSWQNTLVRAAPLMLTALCVALPARVGMIIIGGEGALVIGGLMAAGWAHVVQGMSPWTVFLSMAVVGTVSGGLWVLLAGVLRLYRGVNETISSLLLTYIAIAILNHMCEGPWHDPTSLNNPSTWEIGSANMLGHIFSSDIHWGLVYGVVACVFAWLLMDHTVFGFSARIIGGNSRAAKLIGLSIGRISMLACFLAGAAAALAGVVEVAAVQGKANASLVAGYGYQGILVAFMARQNPLAIIPVAILMGGIAASGGLLQREQNLPDAAVLVLQGIIFVMILGFETFYGRLKIFQSKGVARG